MLSYDYANFLTPRVGPQHGLEPAMLERFAERFRTVYEAVEAQRRAGELGFFDLPYDDGTVRQIEALANGVGQAFETVVVLGIGGSALGTRAIAEALLPPFWNELDEEGRDFYPRLYVLDNIDPRSIAALLRRLDLRRTLVNVVSKSGATAETLAQYLVVRQALESELGDGYRRHFIFTTDPDRGPLRELAREHHVATLPIPPNVGGRYSVLSAVGLLPAALVGVPIRELLAGARAMDEACRTPALLDNPAGLFASLQYLADTARGARIHVLMPYSDRLRRLADWFAQLWAESLGKRYARDGREVFVGPTPVAALGATDQHSQLQLYSEGPFDKTITFLVEDDLGEDLPIPDLEPTRSELAYLAGHTLGELLRAEWQATAASLTRRGRLNATVHLPRLDAFHLGALFFWLEAATLYAGHLYEVNPLDQPGVELGKELTYALLGRPGYAERRGEAVLPDDPRWRWPRSVAASPTTT